MADLKISELNALAGADLATADVVAVVDTSASETKKLTVTALVENAVDFIADDSIPSAKISFSDESVAGGALVNGGVVQAKIASSAVAASKLADDSSAVVGNNSIGTDGVYRGQLAVDTSDNKTYAWSGSEWIRVKASGSINSVTFLNSPPISFSKSITNDILTINAAIADSTAAGQFVAGPSGSSGTVSLRGIVGADLPAASATAKGGVIVNGNGLEMDDDTIKISNTVSAQADAFHVVKYDANGLVTGSRAVSSSDLPTALSTTVGVVKPGTGLSVTAAGALNHSNFLTSGTATKITFDAQGHVTVGASLEAADIPEIPATKITSETLSSSVFPVNGITGSRLADFATTVFGGASSTSGVTIFPESGEFVGQYFFEENRNDLYIWSGSAWVPVTVTSGELVFAGIYDASENEIKSLTSAGQAVNGFAVGDPLPTPSAANAQFYFVVEDSGTGTGNAPQVALDAPDHIISDGSSWTLLDVSGTIAGNTASNVTYTPPSGTGLDISSGTSDVQAAIDELDAEKLSKALGGALTGAISVNTNGSILMNGGTFKFEGSTADDYELEIAATDPTADRTITFPDVTGDVVTTGDSQTVTNAMLAGSITYSKLTLQENADGKIVNADIKSDASIAYGKLNLTDSIVSADFSATAEIAYSKLNLTDSILNADISSSASIAYSKLNLTTSIVDGDISESASIADSKLATISTAGKVNGGAINTGTVGGDTIWNTSGNITTSGTITDGTGSIRRIPQEEVTDTTVTRTLSSDDVGKHLRVDADVPSVTVPVDLDVGDNITIFNNRTSDLSIVQDTGVTLRSGGSTATGNRTLAGYGVATILCVAEDVYVITGTGIS